MTIIKYIPESVELDEIQTQIVHRLEEVARQLQDYSFFEKISNKFSIGTKPAGVGIYLHGRVGRGKTMIMQAFYDRLECLKEFVHYQDFMQNLHIRMHSIQSSANDRPMQDLAKEIAGRSRVLCIDEFEIKDITDAMLIMRLFGFLRQRGVFIFLTTNTLPDNLYKDGLQRELFMPFIDMAKKDFEIIFLDSQNDYRFDKIKGVATRVLYPLNDIHYKLIETIKCDLTGSNELVPSTIEVFGRDVIFQATCRQVLLTSFDELIDRDFGYADFVNICRQYGTIVLEDVPEIEESENDKITRFINFIDNAYFYKVLLFVTLADAPEKIYKHGRKIDEFQRTISRLNEMNSLEYLQERVEDYRSK